MAFKFTFTGLINRVNSRLWEGRKVASVGARSEPPQIARASMRGPAMYIIARNITGPRLRCEALMVDKKSFTPWPPVNEDGWRRAYKFRDRLMAEVVRLEADPLGEELKVIEAVYIP